MADPEAEGGIRWLRARIATKEISLLLSIGAPSWLYRIYGDLAAPALIEAMAQEAPYGCQDLHSALGAIGKRAVPALLDELRHGEPGMRGKASEALGRLKDRSTAMALMEALKDDSPLVRWQSIIALRDMGHEMAVRPFIDMLCDRDQRVRQEAAASLGWFGGSRELGNGELPLILASLRRALDDSNQSPQERWRTREWALRAFKRISEGIRKGKAGLDMDGHMLERRIARVEKKGAPSLARRRCRA